eukprot:COSAG03_NODE_8406_length_806_cov_2.420085_1_plen_170_part_00
MTKPCFHDEAMENYCILYRPSTKVSRGLRRTPTPRDRVISNVDLGSQKKNQKKRKEKDGEWAGGRVASGARRPAVLPRFLRGAACDHGPDRGCQQRVVEEAVEDGGAGLAVQPCRREGVAPVGGGSAGWEGRADGLGAVRLPAVPGSPLRQVWASGAESGKAELELVLY